MTFSIKGPLEAVLDVEASGVASRCRRDRRVPTAVTRPADEIERSLAGDSVFGEASVQTSDEIGDDRTGGEVVPLDQNGILSNARKDRYADKDPFRPAPHVNQDGRVGAAKDIPGIPYRYVAGI